MKPLVISLVLAGAGLLVSTPAHATNRESVFQMQQVLETRITPVVRAMDPNAIVYVKLKTATKENAPLPGTPFVVQDLTLKDAQGEVQIERVEVIILCKQPKLSKSVSDLITSIAAGLGPVDLKVNKLPNELRPRPEPTIMQMKDQKKPAEPVATTPAAGAWSTESMMKDGRFMLFVLGLLALAIVGVGAAFTLAFQRGSMKLVKAMENGLGGLASAFESASSGGSNATLTASEDSKGMGNLGATSAVASVGSGGSDIFAGLPAEGLLNLLTDCYWGEFDSYAAYIWRNIPVERRAPLLAQAVFLPEYTAYLSGIAEQPLGAEQEPCYLNPLPTWHLDNATLTSVVRMHPQLRYKISSLRVAGLQLQPRERIDIIRNAMNAAATALPDFKLLPPSQKRQLRMRGTVTLSTVAEEKDVLSMPNLSVDIMEMTPTLAWLSNLPEAVLKDELSRFSAKDLATAWIGPDEILEKLNKQLPQKKADMLKSYKDKVAPSRTSSAFVALHRRSIAVLRDPSVARVRETAKAA